MDIKNTAITATMVIQSLVKLLENEDVDISSVKFKVGLEGNSYESPEFELEKLIDLAVNDLDEIKQTNGVPEGFVLVTKEQFDSLNMFKDIYKRAIINARKRKDQLNWAHVAGLGVGSGRAVELCKMLNINPSATNMNEVIEAQEQGYE